MHLRSRLSLAITATLTELLDTLLDFLEREQRVAGKDMIETILLTWIPLLSNTGHESKVADLARSCCES